jgi:hypothetical protein
MSNHEQARRAVISGWKVAACHREGVRDGNRDHRISEDALEKIRVAYQAIWFDSDLRDSVYTPEQVRQARKVVRHGPVRHYLRRW